MSIRDFLCFLPGKRLAVLTACHCMVLPGMADAEIPTAKKPAETSRVTERLLLANDHLALWLKADAGVTADKDGFVQQWEDQSGHDNHAIQTNASSRPHWTKENSHGQPSLHFNGISHFLEIPHSSSLTAESAIAIFAVVRVADVVSNYNSILSKTTNNMPAPFDLYLDRPTGQPRLFTGDGRTFSYDHLYGNSNVSSGQWTIICAEVQGTNGMIYHNGAFSRRAPMATRMKDAGGALRIGTRDAFEHWLTGDLAEILFFRGPVSDAERTSVHDYLGSKYGVDVVLDLTVAEQPVVGRFAGQTATFSVSAFASHPTIQYQWQKNGVDIPGATNGVYTTPALTFADSNNSYRARVSSAGSHCYGPSVRLEIFSDTEPLTSTTAAFLLRDQSASEAGNILPPYSSRLWQTGDDPTRNVIQSIAQTSDGVLWLATQGGLARFDTEQFEFVPIGSTNRLTKQPVNTLCADADSLWVGTTGEGLFQLRGEQWIGHPMPVESDLNILTLRRLREDSIWIGTSKGLAVFENEKLAWREDKNDSAPGPGKDATTQIVRSMAQDANGDIWVGAGNHLICLRERVTVTNLNLAAFHSIFIRSVCCTRDGSVWMGASSGLIRWRDGRFTHFAKTNGLPDNMVTAVYEDRRGNLWIGTAGGLCRFMDEKFVVELTSDGEAYDQIFCLFEDREDNLWIGAKNGLYQLRVQQFTTYTTRHGLAHNNVISVCEDHDGAMWIGTWGGGLHCLRSGKITIYSSAKSKTMRNDLVLAISGSRAGGIWFGEDYDGDLYRLKDGEISRYSSDQGFNPNPIRALLEDSDGRLLIGTALNSLQILERGKVASYDVENALPSKRIRCLLQGRDGRIWVGTEGGLACKTKAGLRTLTIKDGLPDNVILALYEDREENLWIGTGRGLNKLQNNAEVRSSKPEITNHISRFTFLHDAVLEILEDDFGQLWLATRRGVVRVNKNELAAAASDQKHPAAFTIFGKTDGMTSPVCVGVAKPSACKSRDGRLWFATAKGLAVTDPKLQIPKNEKSPFVVIRELMVDKKRIRESGVSSRETQGEKEKGRKGEHGNSPFQLFSSVPFLIPPGRGELEFRYTALSYAEPEKNRFKYKLEGLDADWIDAGTRRTAFYNNVPPGDYTFHVIACNNDGVWNSLGSNVKLALQPHYWQTWWFKTFVILASLSCVGFTVRYATKKRMQFKLERLEQQHAVEKERTRIAQDMHDELGARLTEIRVVSNLTAKNKEQPAAVEAGNLRISHAAGELIDNLHSIVWAVNPTNDSLEKLTDYICAFAQPFLQSSSIRCRFECPTHLPDYPLSSEVRHHVFLVVKEALNNIVKHAEASEVRIAVAVSDSKLSFSIADNGKGFPTGNTSALGNGLQNMEKRIQSIHGRYQLLTTLGAGTTIRFDIPIKNANSH